MAARVGDSPRQGREEPPPLEQGCWTALGKKVMSSSCGPVKFFGSFCFKSPCVLDERYDRITSECIQTLKQQQTLNDQHYAIALWATRSIRFIVNNHPNGIRDPKHWQLQPLIERFQRFILPHSSYARYISQLAKEQPWRPLPDLILQNNRHSDCRVCALTKTRAAKEKEARSETGKQILGLFFPESQDKMPLWEQGDSDYDSD